MAAINLSSTYLSSSITLLLLPALSLAVGVCVYLIHLLTDASLPLLLRVKEERCQKCSVTLQELANKRLFQSPLLYLSIHRRVLY